MTSLSLKIKAKRSATEWHVTCEETGDYTYTENLEEGLQKVVEMAAVTLKDDLETPKRIVLSLEDIKAMATLSVSFQDNRGLTEFGESEEEDEDEIPALPEGQKSLPPGEGEEEVLV